MVELIKNAYDADARKVVVFGEEIKDGDNGLIVIRDDGVGMTARIFERGFLTIAGRTKTELDLTSPVFHRRYTVCAVYAPLILQFRLGAKLPAGRM